MVRRTPREVLRLIAQTLPVELALLCETKIESALGGAEGDFAPWYLRILLV